MSRGLQQRVDPEGVTERTAGAEVGRFCHGQLGLNRRLGSEQLCPLQRR